MQMVPRVEKDHRMLNYQAATVRYEPYPLAVLRPALPSPAYAELVSTYPDTSIFGKVPSYDYKLSLSEKFNSKNYHDFIARTPPWRQFHSWLKSDDFIIQTVAFLKSLNIDLGLELSLASQGARLTRALTSLARGRLPNVPPRLRSRFEFSVLKADGGEVAPHTDTPKKIITLVLSMVNDTEWDPAMGGGLDINRPTDTAYAYNYNNRMVPWDKIEVIDTVPFLPNQCVVFVKTFNSLHSVRRMSHVGSSALRKTVTIVIEQDE
jgi:hypothetical protein